MNANESILNKLFTKSVFKELVQYNESPVYARAIQSYTSASDTKDNKDLISEIYSYMAKSYRNEYFYQNTLVNKILLGRHNVNTTSALTQITIGNSKADFVLINGNAIVYEIKSDLDNFERITSQINDYYKAFTRVCILTSENNFDKLYSLLKDTNVGICVLTRRNTISKLLTKDAIEFPESLEHKYIFKVMRKPEYENLLLQFYKKLPEVSQVYYYDKCFELFSKIPIIDAYNATIRQLKERNKIRQKQIDSIPYELKSLAYFAYQTEKDLDNLNLFLSNKWGG